MIFIVAVVAFASLIVVLYSFIRTGMWIFGSIGRAGRRLPEPDADEPPADPFKPRSGWSAPVQKPSSTRGNDLDTGRTKLPDRTGRW